MVPTALSPKNLIRIFIKSFDADTYFKISKEKGLCWLFQKGVYVSDEEGFTLGGLLYERSLVPKDFLVTLVVAWSLGRLVGQIDY